MKNRTSPARSYAAFILAGVLLLGLAATVGWWSPQAPDQPALALGAQAYEESESQAPLEGSGERVLAPVPASVDPEEAAPPAAQADGSATSLVEAELADIGITGAAVRVAAGGLERAGEDGSMTVSWRRVDGRFESREVQIGGGRFALECPPNVPLNIGRLQLGGAAIALPVSQGLAIPEDRFLLLKGKALHAVELSVVADENGRDLPDVEVYVGAGDAHRAGHPGNSTLGEAPIASGASPLQIQPKAASRSARRNYWVRSPGRAWAVVRLDHKASGQREVRLVGCGELDVALVGNEDWLGGEVKLWRSEDDGREVVNVKPDERQEAHFGQLAAGGYRVTYERGHGDSRMVFAEEAVTLAQGERSALTLGVVAPQRPQPTFLEGTLRIPSVWSEEGALLRIHGQGVAGAWQGKRQALAIGEMRRIEAGLFAWRVDVASAGDYELAVEPFYVRHRLQVPEEGLSGLELNVPEPADVEVRVVDADTREELLLDSLQWSPNRIEGLKATPLLRVAAHPDSGRVHLRVPAMDVLFWMRDQSLARVTPGEVFALEPGPQTVELEVSRRLKVQLRFLDGEAEVPFSWDWQLSALRVEDGAGPSSESIGALWFDEPGSYRLSNDGPIEGFQDLEEISLDVLPFSVSGGEQQLDVPLTRG